MAPISINGTTGIAGVDGSAAAPALQGSDTNTGIAFGSDVIIGSTGGTERFRCDSSGRMLVGTSSARNNITQFSDPYLQIEGNYSRSISVLNNENNGNASGIALSKIRSTSVLNSGDIPGIITFGGYDGTQFREAANIQAVIDGTPGAGDMPGRLVFSVTRDGGSSPTEAARIINTGHLKISDSGNYISTTSACHEINQTTNSDYILRTRANTASPSGINIQYSNATPNGAGNEFLYCVDQSALRASIRSNGGLANYSANNANLSDRNAKKDISPAADTWDCIKEWEIVNYRYKDQPDDADLNLGVIAQQVAESCPEVITVFEEAKDDQPEKLGIKEQQMYWMAIKALQEAQVRIEQLEAKVAALESA